MKCIKRGTPPQKRTWMGHCLYCGSIFEAFEGELENIVTDAIDHARMAKSKCEICEQEFWLFPKKIK